MIAMTKRVSLRQEIALLLIVKLLLLALIWHLFFAKPVDQKIGAADVAAHFNEASLYSFSKTLKGGLS